MDSGSQTSASLGPVTLERQRAVKCSLPSTFNGSYEVLCDTLFPHIANPRQQLPWQSMCQTCWQLSTACGHCMAAFQDYCQKWWNSKWKSTDQELNLAMCHLSKVAEPWSVHQPFLSVSNACVFCVHGVGGGCEFFLTWSTEQSRDHELHSLRFASMGIKFVQ